MMIFIFIVICIAVYFMITNQSSGVERELARGFPEEWEKILEKKVGFYHTLNPELKEKFKSRIHQFILTKPISGYQIEVDDTLKVLVASSAVMLTLSFEKWNFDYMEGVIVVDDALNEDASEGGGIVSGLLRTKGYKSDMVLSRSALEQGFKNINDKKNVAVHEFAHALDHMDGEVDGVPEFMMPESMRKKWVELMDRKIDEINRKRSDIDPYGATNKAEFFAVITEYFFEKPGLMQKKHPEVYEVLSNAFQQDLGSQFNINLKQLMGKIKRNIGRNSPCPCGSGKKFKKCCLN